MNETIVSIFNELHLDTNYQSTSLNAIAQSSSRYLKDLKLNITGVLKSNHLTKKETALLALAVAVNQQHQVLIAGLTKLATDQEATAEEIAEIHTCTSLMNANTYYNNTPAGMRMSIMMNPVLGKEFFELISLSISSLNGCELCVTSHEASVKQHGASEARVYDAIRLTAVFKSLTAIL
jgi:alkyl hydroperoxide reductase subunit D